MLLLMCKVFQATVTNVLHADVECEEGAVRLVGGVNKSSGILDVCTNGLWGRVCNALRYWGSENAKVVFHQMGFLEERKYNFHPILQ